MGENMFRSIAFFLLVISFLFRVGFGGSERLESSANVIFDEERSFLRHFDVEDDDVYIYWYLVVNNNSAETHMVKLLGDFREDYGILISERFVYAMDPETKSSDFEVPPGESILDVVFIGKKGLAGIKQTRLLPYIKLIEE